MQGSKRKAQVGVGLLEVSEEASIARTCKATYPKTPIAIKIKATNTSNKPTPKRL
jgi:hypothetical protein